MSEIHIFVNNQENSMSLCRIILKNIVGINVAGIHLKIHKVRADQQTVTHLKSIGVQRIPSMIIPSGQVINGTAKIVEVIRDMMRDPVERSTAEGGNSLEAFYRQELLNHKENGPICDDGRDDDSHWDPAKATKEYAQRNARHGELKPIWHESSNNDVANSYITPPENKIDAGFVGDIEDHDSDTDLLLKRLLG